MQKAANRALAAYLDRLERTLGLLGPLAVIHQPTMRDSGTIAILSHDKPVNSPLSDALAWPIPLRNSSRQIDLLLYLSVSWQLSQDLTLAGTWRVHQTSYLYRICDCSGQALLEFHYHPVGTSWHRGYHAHAMLGSARSLHLFGHPERTTRELHGRKFHIPTQEIVPEDIVDLLRKDFGVRLTDNNEQRVDAVLATNRASGTLLK